MLMANGRIAVIGAGCAGLACAAYLAKAGKHVVVFEQHSRPGGYWSSYTRKGIIFDHGPHWTVMPETVNNMLKEVNVPPIEFSPVESIGRYISSENEILLSKNREKLEETILKSFPSTNRKSLETLIELSLETEEEIIRMPMGSTELLSRLDTLKMLLQIPFKMRKVLKYSRMPIVELLEKLFPGDDLKGLRTLLHLITPIEGVSAIGLLVFIAFALKGKAYHPIGGAQKVADAWEYAVRENGGEIRYSNLVTQIETENGRAVGVILDDGSKWIADYVVSTVDAKQTFLKFINTDLVPQHFQRKLDTHPISYTYFTVAIITDIDPAQYGFDGTDVFFTPTADLTQLFTANDPNNGIFGMSFPKYRTVGADPNHFGIQVLSRVTFDFENYWRSGPELHRGKAYQEFKTAYAWKILKQIEQYIPDLKKHVLHLDVATPITMHRYTLNHQGAATGWSYTKIERWKQKIPFVKGLYHAGHWTGPSGIPQVLISGKNAAELILRDK